MMEPNKVCNDLVFEIINLLESEEDKLSLPDVLGILETVKLTFFQVYSSE